MEKIELIKDAIITFVKLAKRIEDTITKRFDLVQHPYLEAGRKFPKKGEIPFNRQKIEFRYHGAGNTFILSDGLIIDYDVAPLNKNTIKLSGWKFLRFIETTQLFELSNLTRTELIGYFEILERQNILKRTIKGYDVFEVEEEWLKTIITNH
ncbi:MAG: hypothetical protein AAF960_22470 [Bacteroidota bacterium]